LTNGLVKITLDHHNKTLKILKLGLIGFLDSILIAASLSECSLTTDDPCAIVNQKTSLSRGLDDPFLLVHLGDFFEGLHRDILQGATHTVNDPLKISFDFTVKLELTSEFDSFLTNI
jgi:hypothetical protein